MEIVDWDELADDDPSCLVREDCARDLLRDAPDDGDDD
jgi:hypothetical protein